MKDDRENALNKIAKPLISLWAAIPIKSTIQGQRTQAKNQPTNKGDDVKLNCSENYLKIVWPRNLQMTTNFTFTLHNINPVNQFYI